ncbi:hypothetical protein BGX20_002590 [Mortierella sp. AD010]|nr:hypothetical protein BGX20_002590 [Mortierella sp. AD010]
MEHSHNQQQQSEVESTASSSTAVNYNTQYGSSSSSATPSGMSVPLVYPLLAEALVREGFPGFASVLAFTQDQRQLEQALDHHPYSSSSGYQQDQHIQQQQQLQQPHQHQNNLQDDSYLLDFVVQEHNMLMAQHGYNGSSSAASSSSTPYPQGHAMQSNDPAFHDSNSPYNIMGEMQPFEVMQYNSLVLDGHYLDALPYSIIQGGCGGDSPGMDTPGWCDPSLAGANYIGEQYPQQINIHQMSQPQQQFQQGYFDPSLSSGSSTAGPSSAGPSSSPSGPASGYGFNYPAWSAAHAGLLYPQGDFLLERKREGAAGIPRTTVQPHLEPAEEDDDSDEDDDDDAEEFGEVEDEAPGMLMPTEHYGFRSGNYPVDDLHVPPLTGRSARRPSYGQKNDRNDDRMIGAPPSKRSRSDATTTAAAVAAAAAAASVAAQRRASSGAPGSNHNNHSRNSSMSSIHSHSSLLDNHSSSTSSSSSSSPNGKAPRQQADTIEKRMHPCTVAGCHKSFTRAFNLRSHLNTHNGERPHKCPEPGCDWDFVRRHDLDRHVKSKHMANKPYACRQCTSRFGRSDALQRHRRLENHM